MSVPTAAATGSTQRAEPASASCVEPCVEPASASSVEPCAESSVEPSVGPSVDPRVDPRVENGADPSARAEWLLLLAGAALLVCCLDVQATGDSRHRWRFLLHAFERGEIGFMKYSAIGPLSAIPLLWLDRLLDLGGRLAVRFNLVLFLASLAGFWYLLRPSLGARVTRRFLLLLLAGSMFPGHLAFFNNEPYTALLVALGLAVVCLRARAFGWGAAAVGVANTPASLVGLGVVVARRLLVGRRLRVGMALVAAAGLILADMWLRQGTVGATTGYEGDRGLSTALPYSGKPGFSYPFVLGVLSILLAFGKGLVFFAPGLLLQPRHRLGPEQKEVRELHLQWLLFVVGLVLVYAKWWSWYGGRTWGPRFFLIASVPASLALAVYLDRPSPRALVNLLVGGIALWSAWVGISGGVFQMCGLPEHPSYEHFIWYIPEYSVLLRPFLFPPELRTDQIALLGFGCVVAVYLSAGPFCAAGRQAVARCRGLSFAHAWRW